MENKKLKKVLLILGALFIFGLLAGAFPGLNDRENSEDGTITVCSSETEPTDETFQESMERSLSVYVYGAVLKPGVYELSEGSRVHDAVAAAGGYSWDADPSSLNPVKVLKDGEMLYVAKEGETVSAGSEEADGRIDLNTAGKTALMSLPGIGDAKAQAIIAYREENGAFQSIEDIKKVSGIGENLFSQIKTRIKV